MLRGDRFVAGNLVLQFHQMFGEADQPAVTQPACPQHGGLADRTDPQRRCVAVQRRRHDGALVDLEMLPAVREFLTGHRQTQDLQAFLEAARAVLESPTNVLELVGLVADARSQDETVVRHFVDRVDLLGDLHGMVCRQQHDVGRHLHGARARQQSGQHGERSGRLGGDVAAEGGAGRETVLAAPAHLEAEIFHLVQVIVDLPIRIAMSRARSCCD